MRFMYVMKSESETMPTPAFLAAAHKLAQREITAGRMLDNAALAPVALGKQVRLKKGELSLVDGPFVEAKEIVGGYAIFDLPTMDEAVAMANEFMRLHKEHMPGWEGTCEIRVVATPPGA